MTLWTEPARPAPARKSPPEPQPRIDLYALRNETDSALIALAQGLEACSRDNESRGEQYAHYDEAARTVRGLISDVLFAARDAASTQRRLDREAREETS